jgi:hypothetical protein
VKFTVIEHRREVIITIMGDRREVIITTLSKLGDKKEENITTNGERSILLGGEWCCRWEKEEADFYHHRG